MTLELPKNAQIYAARGSMQRAWGERRDWVLSGPAGTGKSRGILERLNALCQKYQQSRHLIVRKTRSSLTQSGLVTFEQHVKPACDVDRMQRNVRDEYRYPNGSVIVVGGMDKPEKVLSTEYDTIYLQEAIEFTEGDWDTLSSRCRNGVMPYQQMVADTNPGKPSHFLKTRANAGQLLMFESRHEDNPRMWDLKTQTWTEYGSSYISRLDRLTGVRKLRLRNGVWAAAEGMIYESWDSTKHIVDYDSLVFPFSNIPRHWRKIRVIDFGYNNAFVCSWFAIDPDGRLILYREWYMTKMIVEDHAKKILELEAEGQDGYIEATICDHDAEDRATLTKHLECQTIPADKRVKVGIEAVEARLRADGQDRPRFLYINGALVEPDLKLLEPDDDSPPKPTSSIQEVDSYVYDPRAGHKEQPVKENDHGMDTWRYACLYADRPRKKRNNGGSVEVWG